MAALIQAIRGMNDILPPASNQWHALEALLIRLVSSYGYQEMRLPLLEKTELFHRSIGEVTDIVEKEMYTFADRNGDSLTLRPEGTAGCVRAALEHGLLYNQIQRLWYLGPMFRHERPQRGRYRQFQQLGVEAFGMAGPEIDAELILLTSRFWQTLGITEHLELQLNSLGSAAARVEYRKQLVTYFTAHATELDEDSQRRLTTNPLRILDSKNPALQSLIANAPTLLNHLDPESEQHFTALRNLLDKAQVPYTLNQRLVRGLDYYNKTVFEWVSTDKGAQNTVCAGGRYDGLVEQLGGQTTPAIGFALGLERLLYLWTKPEEATVDVYLLTLGEAARQESLVLAEKIRTNIPQLRLLTDCSGAGVKSQFKRADKSGAKIALVLGEDELKQQTITVKYLREEQPQQTIPWNDLTDYLMRHVW